MKKFYIISALAVLVITFTMCNKASVFSDNGYDIRLSGGDATVFDATSHALTNPVDGLNTRDLHVHEVGDKAFEQIFVAAPAPLFAGLGPVFNNISCINCHRNDGEGIPTAGFSNSGLLMRISLPGADANGGPMTVPGFGGQLQDQAVLGTQPEVHVNINYTDLPITYPDGSVVTLRQPVYEVVSPYTTLPPNCMYSPRLAPPIVGMGLLELISESTIISFQDPNDVNNDGIRGKANYVYDVYTKQKQLGRFGWKANTAFLLTQVATAYQQDMGLTSYVQSFESAAGQSQMNGIPVNNKPDLADTILNATTFYVRTLAVPARRDINDPDVQRGEYFFKQLNCIGCHQPTVQTGVDLTMPQLSNQRIHPYTDLLVHDMGPGLADGRPDYLAGGADWRTAPLWGIGLLEKANGIPYFLHDGRARTLEESILWHGGEAQNAKNQFMQLSKADRDRLIKFIQSL